MAENFTLIQPQQEANTAILPQNTEVVDAYFKHAEDKFKEKVFNYKQHEDELAKLAASTNFDTKGIWPVDEDAIRNKIFSTIDFVHQHPDAIDPSSPLYTQYKQGFEDANMAINKSKQDKLYYDNSLKGVVDKKLDPDVLPQIQDFRDKGLEREWTPLEPKVDFNIFDVAKQAKLSYELGQPENSGIAGVQKFSKVPTDESIQSNVDAMWSLPSVQKEFGNKDAFSQTMTPILKSMKGEDVLHNIPGYGSSEWGGYGEKDLAEANDRVKLIKDLQALDPNAKAAMLSLTYQGKPIVKADYINTNNVAKAGEELPNSPFYPEGTRPQTGQTGKTILRITNADGDTYDMDLSERGTLDINNQLNFQQGTNISSDLINRLMGVSGKGQPKKVEEKAKRTVVKTGTYNGKKVVQYSDGSVEYAE